MAMARRKTTKKRTLAEWEEGVRRAGRAGGLARAKSLTPEELSAIAKKASAAGVKARMKLSPAKRSEIAKKAAQARWGKKKRPE
jgi:hypothetical protein